MAIGTTKYFQASDNNQLNSVTYCFASPKEGFCLCVTEALWKGTPVVASNVGGIPSQIEDGENGFLLAPDDTNGFAERIIHILKNPNEAKGLGENAKETVRQKFLITRLLSDYLYMLNSIVK